jgi:hypothetical protein
MRYVDPTGLFSWETWWNPFTWFSEKEQAVSIKEADNIGHQLAGETVLFTEKMYGDKNPHNNEADAYRHATWSAAITKEIGADYAWVITTGYETKYEWKYNIVHPLEFVMDTYNNALGRRLGLDPKCPSTHEGIASFVYQNRELLQKRLWYIPKHYKY